MSSIPKMSSFPTVIETVGWRWDQLAAPDRELDGFWIGVDADGNKWLTKLRGSFYAYREIVFAKLAQTMGWSCQSSVFIRIDVDSAEKLGVQAFEVHAAHWFMNEHCPSACGPRCPFVPIINGVRCNLEYISKSQIKYMMDWPKSVIASYVFGGSEPPDRFFTSDHEFVIIDSEQMFATGPVCFDSDRWLVNDDESPSVLGRDIA